MAPTPGTLVLRQRDGRVRLLDAQGRDMVGVPLANGWLAEDGLHGWTGSQIPFDLQIRSTGGWMLWPCRLGNTIAAIRIGCTDAAFQTYVHFHDVDSMFSRHGWRMAGEVQPWPLSAEGWLTWTGLWAHHPWDSNARCNGRRSEPRLLRLPYLDTVILWPLQSVSDWPSPRAPLRFPPWTDLRYDVVDIRWEQSGSLVPDVWVPGQGQAAWTCAADGADRFGWVRSKAWLFLQQVEGEGRIGAVGASILDAERRIELADRVRPEISVLIDDDGSLMQGAFRTGDSRGFQALSATVDGHAFPGWSTNEGWDPGARTHGVAALAGGDDNRCVQAVLEIIDRSDLTALPVGHVHALEEWSGDSSEFQAAETALNKLGIGCRVVSQARRGGWTRWPAQLPLDNRRVARAAAAMALHAGPSVPVVLTVMCDLRADALEVAAVLCGNASKWPESPTLVATDRWALSLSKVLDGLLAVHPGVGPGPVQDEDDADRLLAWLSWLAEPRPARSRRAMEIRSVLKGFSRLVSTLVARFAVGSLSDEAGIAGWLQGSAISMGAPAAKAHARKLLESAVSCQIQVGFSGWGWLPWWAQLRPKSVLEPGAGKHFADDLRRQIQAHLASRGVFRMARVRVEGDGSDDLEGLRPAGLPVHTLGWPLQAAADGLGPVSLLHHAERRSPFVVDVVWRNKTTPWWHVAPELAPPLPEDAGLVNPWTNAQMPIKRGADRSSPVAAFLASASCDALIANDGLDSGR